MENRCVGGTEMSLCPRFAWVRCLWMDNLGSLSSAAMKARERQWIGPVVESRSDWGSIATASFVTTSRWSTREPSDRR